MAFESPYQLPANILLPLAQSEDLLARLDERVAHSLCSRGFVARRHFADAVAALWLEGAAQVLRSLREMPFTLSHRYVTGSLQAYTGALAARRQEANTRFLQHLQDLLLGRTMQHVPAALKIAHGAARDTGDL